MLRRTGVSRDRCRQACVVPFGSDRAPGHRSARRSARGGRRAVRLRRGLPLVSSRPGYRTGLPTAGWARAAALPDRPRPGAAAVARPLLGAFAHLLEAVGFTFDSLPLRRRGAPRSQRFGQLQSKSQSGLKRPIRAALTRRSRLRRARSCSSQSSSGATQPAVAISAQWAVRPCRCSAVARARKVSGLLIGLVFQLVIGLEPVRLHGHIA